MKNAVQFLVGRTSANGKADQQRTIGSASPQDSISRLIRRVVPSPRKQSDKKRGHPQHTALKVRRPCLH